MGQPTILIGTDFSPAGERALMAGRELAIDLGARVVLAHAITSLPGTWTYSIPLGGPTETMQVAEGRIGQNEAIELTTKWAKPLRDAGLEVDVEASEGNPEDVILAAARKHGALLIVVGSHGHRGFKKFVLGSVAQSILHQTSIPVLVVPAAKRRPRRK